MLGSRQGRQHCNALQVIARERETGSVVLGSWKGRQHCNALQVIAREREIAAMEASHKAAMSLLEEQLLNAESRLARESEQCRHLEHR